MEEVKNLVSPLHKLHDLRNKEAHGDTSGLLKEARNARNNHGSLCHHFRELTEQIYSAMQEIVRLLG